MSSIKGEVLRSQGRILDMLIDCESQLAVLYESFAVAFPRFAAFWRKLAGEEHQHAEVLEGLHFILARGFLFNDIGRFSQEKLKPMRVILDEASHKVASAKMQAIEAFTTALQLEHSLVESRFYAEVTSDAPEFAIRCKVLQTETEAHIQWLEAIIAKETGAAPAGKPPAPAS